MPIISAFLFLIVISAIYITSYVLNHRTEQPYGFENMNEKCGSCSVKECAARPKEDTIK